MSVNGVQAVGDDQAWKKAVEEYIKQLEAKIRALESRKVTR